MLVNKILKQHLKEIILEYTSRRSCRGHKTWIYEDILYMIDHKDVPHDILHLLIDLFSRIDNISVLPDDKVNEDLPNNNIFQTIGLGTPDLITGLLILAVIYNKIVTDGERFSNRFVSDLDAFIYEDSKFHLSLLEYNEMNVKIKEIVSKYIKGLNSIFDNITKDLTNTVMMEKLEDLLLELQKDIIACGSNINKETSFLCNCKCGRKKYKVYDEPRTDEIFKLRIEMPEEEVSKYLYGNYSGIKALLVNKKGNYLKCYSRRAHDEDYVDDESLYLSIKYYDLNELIRETKDYELTLYLVLADDLADDFYTYCKNISLNLKNVEAKFDRIVYKTNMRIDISKLTKE